MIIVTVPSSVLVNVHVIDSAGATLIVATRPAPLVESLVGSTHVITVANPGTFFSVTVSVPGVTSVKT